MCKLSHQADVFSISEINAKITFTDRNDSNEVGELQ